MSLLSDKDIKKNRDDGNIVIEPFEDSNLSNTSYDVTLGEWYYRENKHPNIDCYNPYFISDVKKV